MKAIELIHENLKNGDMFFSKNDRSLLCWIIRRVSKDDSNHVGFILDCNDSFIGAEMNAKGSMPVSLSHYESKHDQIIAVYRFIPFEENSLLLERAMSEVASNLEHIVRYDYKTLFRKWKVTSWMFKGKDTSDEMICSEWIFRTLVKYGMVEYPVVWDTVPPAPGDLRWFFSVSKQFKKIVYKR